MIENGGENREREADTAVDNFGVTAINGLGIGRKFTALMALLAISALPSCKKGEPTVKPQVQCANPEQDPNVEIARRLLEKTVSISSANPSTENASNCAALIINKRTLLTASHCVDGDAELESIMGTELKDNSNVKSTKWLWLKDSKDAKKNKPVFQRHENKDLAVIVFPHDIFDDDGSFSIANDTTITPGTDVLTCGHPFGYKWVISSGKVKGQLDNGLVDINIATEPGNSGGALVDFRGTLLGVLSRADVRPRINESYIDLVDGVIIGKMIADAEKTIAEEDKIRKAKKPRRQRRSSSGLPHDLDEHFEPIPTPKHQGMDSLNRNYMGGL